MPDAKVSIYGTSNRPHLWKWFYESIALNNNIDFEIVFCGNVRPTFELPSNFKFIYSNVKPVQCIQIAVSHCTGEVLQNSADDLQNSPHSFDVLYDLYKKQNDYKCIMAPRFCTFDGYDCTDWACRITANDANSLPIHVGGIISRKFYNEIGSLDNRFIFSYSDADMQARAQMLGGRIVFSKEATIFERKDLCPGWRQGLFYTYFDNDRGLLNSLWFHEGIESVDKFAGKRLDIVYPFIQNETFLTISQGPKGQWN